jgi:death on curing protein
VEFGEALKKLTEWSRAMKIAFLTPEDSLALHSELIRRYGGAPSLRDVGLLESALAMPQAGFSGKYFHGFPQEMGAAYLFYLVRNYAFIDGNMRIALASAILFLKLNRVPYAITQAEAVELTQAAAGGKADKAAVTAFLLRHITTARRQAPE